MSCCKHRHKSKHHCKGMFYRVTNGIAQQFGLKRKWVIAGFILGLFIHAPLTILLFIAVLFFLNHPDKAEAIRQKASEFFAAPTEPFNNEARTASATPGMDPEDFDFGELREEFAELERRAGTIEQHVTSEEFELNREFNRMKKD